MPVKKPAPPPPLAPTFGAGSPNVYLCPSCGIGVDYRCDRCGATRSTNSVSGNIIWMRNGRLVAAFHDAREAWLHMATQYDIPIEKWPPEFRDPVSPPSTED